MKKTLKVIGLILILGTFLFNYSSKEIKANTSTLEIIKQRKKLIVGTASGYPPYEFKIDENGKQVLKGIDPDLGQLIADDLGVELEIIDMDFDALIPSLKTGKIDIILAAMVDTPKRRASVDFSIPYHESENVFLVLESQADNYKSIEDIAKSRIIVQTATIQEEVAANINAKDVITLPAMPEIVQAMNAHNADVSIVADTTALVIQQQHQQFKILTFPLSGENAKDGASIPIRKNDPEFKAYLDGFLTKKLADGSIKKLILDNSKLAGSISSEGAKGGSYWANSVADLFDFRPVLKWSVAQSFAKGTMVTLSIAFVGVIIGLIIGLGCAIGMLMGPKPLKVIITIYVDFIRATPLIMQLFLIFYVLPVLLTTDPANPMVLPAFVIAVIGISLNSSAYLAEMFRGGIQSVDKGQFEAGRSLGFSNNQTLKLIVIPQAIKNILPTLGNEFIVVIKETAVISLVGGKDILYYGKQIGSSYYNLFPSLVVATLIYYVIVKFFIFILRKYELKMQNKGA